MFLQVRESKRSRTQVAHFESPIPELSQIMKDLKKKEEEEKANAKKPQENPPVFFKYVKISNDILSVDVFTFRWRFDLI